MKKVLDYITIVLGSLLLALAFVLFFIPNSIAPGGVSGLATLLNALFGFKVGQVILIINIPLFLFGWRKHGLKLLVRSLVSTIILSLFIDYLPIPESLIRSLSSDMLLSTVYGGILMGAGVGLVLRSGATTGGTDLMAMLIHDKFASIRVSWVLFGIDFLVVTAAGIFLSPSMALYALVGLFVSVKVMDFVQVGMNAAKAFIIISDHSEAIAHQIIEKLGRGVTALRGKGMYSANDKNVLLCIVRRNQIARLRNLIKSVDENAFVIVYDAKEVLGEGFTRPVRENTQSQTST